MISNSIKLKFSQLFRFLFPKKFWKRKLNYYRSHKSEIEMHLLPLLCCNNKISLDIGGAHGSYTANLYDKSLKVITFEPIPENINWINNMIKFTGINAIVQKFALSDHSGNTILQMVDKSFGFSTIEKENDLSKHNTNLSSINVEIRKLDDLLLDNIGFIKIDVEGHELSVLNGGMRTITSYLPNMLIEIEERHKKDSVITCVQTLEKLGYSCYFVFNNKIFPFSEFNFDFHQKEENIINCLDFSIENKPIYINNFIFINPSSKDIFSQKCQSILDKI